MKQIIAKFERGIDEGDALLTAVAITDTNGNWLPATHPYVKEELGYHQSVFAQSFIRLYPEPSQNLTAFYIYTIVRSTRRELPYRYSVSQVQQPRLVSPVINCSQGLWTPHSTVDQKVISDAGAHYELQNKQIIYFRQAHHLLGPFVSAPKGGFQPLSGDQVYYHEINDHSIIITINGAQYLDSNKLLIGDKNFSYFCFSPERVLKWYQQNFSVASRFSVSPTELLSVSSAESDPVTLSLAKELEGYVEKIELPERILREIFESPRVRPGVLEKIIEKSASLFHEQTKNARESKEKLAKELSEAEDQLSNIKQLINTCQLELAAMEQQRRGLSDTIEELKSVNRKQQLTEAKEIEQSLTPLREKRNKLIQEVTAFTSLIEEINREFDLNESTSYTDFTHSTTKATARYSTEERDFKNAILDYAEDVLGKSLALGTGKMGNEAGALIKALRTSRCILSPNSFVGRLLSGATANATFYHCQTACDWLTYANFDRAILRQAMSTALTNPDRFVFLQLTDYNNSAPACYLQPVLQYLRGASNTLPGGLSWPQNLWLILVPAAVNVATAALPVEADLLRSIVRVCHLEYTSAAAGAKYVEEHSFQPGLFPLTIPYSVDDNGLSHYCDE